MLTKSNLQSFLQCPRKLWLERFKSELIPTGEAFLYRRATDGQIVGQKAREALGPDAYWPQGAEDRATAAQRAAEHLRAHPEQPAVEVPLLRDGLYARADALVPDAGGYVLRETKSSTFPLKSDKVTPGKPDVHHVEDVAIQAWVMEGSGVRMTRAELNLLNNQWVYPGGGDYSGLFRQLDVTADVAAIKASVPTWLGQAQQVLAGGMPQATTGEQCSDPYECLLRDYCEELEPPGEEHPLTLLPDSAGKGLAKKLIAKGYASLLQPSPDELTGAQSDLYRRIQRAHQTGEAVRVPGAETAMSALPYPRYYFDFEGIDLPVPHWAGVRPYEQIPFQWSCHIERRQGVFEHHQFLDLSGDNPSLPCIQKMLEVIDLDDSGPLIVYYQTYEKSRLEGLARRHPEFADPMQRYISRIVDLHPLVKQHYYHPQMRGSFSIKKVLPVVAPDLDYGELGEVQEGTGAQVAYLYACFDPDTTPERKEELKRSLLAYCEQDTWAMVEIGYFLEGRSRPTHARPAHHLD